jgi:hypothetical protein
MLDPITVVGTAALTQAVTFLYGQITDLLRRRRERTDQQQNVPLPEVAAGVLDAALPAATVSLHDLDRVEPELLRVRAVLGDYADEIRPVEADDSHLIETAAKARAILESIYGRRITFAGESGRANTGGALSPEQLAIIASGSGAIAAHTIDAPTATTGGIAAGTITGNVSTGGQAADGAGKS